MKITMYELLGMVKDDKELPKKVKVLDVIYEFNDHYGDYFNEELDRFLFVYMTSEEEWKLAYFLNTQVEILEEEKKIPEKIDNEYFERAGSTYKDRLCKDKINEIITYLESKGE